MKSGCAGGLSALGTGVKGGLMDSMGIYTSGFHTVLFTL